MRKRRGGVQKKKVLLENYAHRMRKGGAQKRGLLSTQVCFRVTEKKGLKKFDPDSFCRKRPKGGGGSPRGKLRGGSGTEEASSDEKSVEGALCGEGGTVGRAGNRKGVG